VSGQRGSVDPVGAIFTFIGAVSLLVALYYLHDLVQFHRASVPAEGVVVAIQKGCSGRSCKNLPIAQFRADGELRQVTGTVGGTPPIWAVGEKLTVRYRRDNPGIARIDHPSESWLIPGLALFFTLIFGGIGAGSLVAARRRRA